MTINDAQIAREWAWKALDNDLLDEVPIEGYRAAARYILATTRSLTMAEVEWDDDVHAGLCAEHAKHGTVRMLSEWNGEIACLVDGHATLWLAPKYLTPIPGTKIDLTPRREPEPESTPEHPAVLATEEDYENAPTGTTVAGDYADPWVKDYRGFWLSWGAPESETSQSMALSTRCVLRWGKAL